MTNKILISIFILFSFVSCNKDFLDRPSQNNPTLDIYYTNAEEVNAATGYLYNQVWADFMDKSYNCIGDILSGNALSPAGDPNYGSNTYVYYTVQSTDGNLLNAWRSFYKVVGNATVLIKSFTEKGDAGYLKQGIAEARFVRGVAYFYIARVFGDAPIVDDPIQLANSGDYNLPRYYQKDILRYALEDLQAAADILPADPYQKGRVTKYSAIGMQAKIYLYMKDYSNAAAKALEVMNSGKYTLYPDYGKMFTSLDASNNSESLFAFQFLGAGGWSYSNALQAYYAPSTLLKPDFNTGYSSVIPSIDMVNAYEFGDLRKKGSIMQQGYFNADWKNTNFPNGFLYDTTWTSSNDDPLKIKTNSRSNILKYVIGPKSVGASFDTQGGNDMCMYVLRYADILLIYAEAILGDNSSSSDGEALRAFNLVRERAGLNPATSLTKDLILHERRVEFAFEGDYFFDIQRQGFARAQQIIAEQERGTYNWDGSGIDSYRVHLSSPSQLFLPIPSDEVIADPELAKPAVAYYK